MTNRLFEITLELREMAEREAMSLWRLARKAEKRCCSQELVRAIRDEAWDLYNSYKVNPGWLLDWRTKDHFKYAFCGERRKHTYLIVDANGTITKIESKKCFDLPEKED